MLDDDHDRPSQKIYLAIKVSSSSNAAITVVPSSTKKVVRLLSNKSTSAFMSCLAPDCIFGKRRSNVNNLFHVRVPVSVTQLECQPLCDELDVTHSSSFSVRLDLLMNGNVSVRLGLLKLVAACSR